MRDNIKNKVDLLVRNREVLEKEFKWGYNIMNIAAALVYTGVNKEVDVARLKECKEILKKNTGMFSSFQSYSEAVVISKMALKDDPEQYLKDIKMVYEKLNNKTVFDSSYLIQGAISICEADRLYDAEMLAGRFKEIYKKMEKKHPFLTSSDDSPFAVMLALTDKPVDQIIDEMEECFTYLKKQIRLNVGADEYQGLGEILALTGGDMKEKCDKVLALYNTFSEHKVKWGREYNEFASLGTLIDLDVDNNVLVEETVEVANYLKNIKGFGDWSLDNKQRLLFAAMMVGDSYNDSALRSSTTVNTTINSTVAMVIAEEVALMMCMMICATASTSTTIIT